VSESKASDWCKRKRLVQTQAIGANAKRTGSSEMEATLTLWYLANEIITFANNKVREYFASREKGRGENLALLDLGLIMMTKSKGEDRTGLQGDSPEHFSAEGRIAFLQALIGMYID